MFVQGPGTAWQDVRLTDLRDLHGGIGASPNNFGAMMRAAAVLGAGRVPYDTNHHKPIPWQTDAIAQSARKQASELKTHGKSLVQPRLRLRAAQPAL